MGLEETLQTSKELGGQFQAERQRLLEADPLIRRLRNIAIGGLKGVNQGALPGDISRSITDRTRQAMAARGMDESSIAATTEAAALTGGAEQFRANRLNQALAVGDRYSAGGQMLSGGVPDFMSLLPFQQNANAAQNQLSQKGYDATMGQYAQLGQLAGTAAGALFGGPMGAMGGGALMGGLLGGGSGGGGGPQAGVDYSAFGIGGQGGLNLTGGSTFYDDPYARNLRRQQLQSYWGTLGSSSPYG
jgi:hypothetical protein